MAGSAPRRLQGMFLMKRTALLLLAALSLGGCLSEINKPIRPGDTWRERAEATSQPMGVD